MRGSPLLLSASLLSCSWLWAVRGQELLGASQGFPALGELVGVIADEVRPLQLLPGSMLLDSSIPAPSGHSWLPG